MTFDESTGDRRLSCQRQLLRLRLLVLSQDGMTPYRLAREIRDATNTVIAQAEAVSRAVVEAGRRDPGSGTFLWVRVTRLAMAADQAVSAARSGDHAALDAHVRHFDSLTCAIWTVQEAVYGRGPRTPGTGRPLPAR